MFGSPGSALAPWDSLSSLVLALAFRCCVAPGKAEIYGEELARDATVEDAKRAAEVAAAALKEW